MAANLDKAESSLTTVSDLSYIRGIDSSGNSVKISKSDLASVLGGFKNVDFRYLPTSSGQSGDLDQANMFEHGYGFRCGWCNNNNIPSLTFQSDLGYCIDFNMGAQLIFEYPGGNSVIFRFRNGKVWETITK